MTDRPEPVDLEPFEGITLPDDWATAYTYGNGKVLHANIPAWLADLTATREELAKYKEHSKGDWHEHCRAYLDEFGIGNIHKRWAFSGADPLKAGGDKPEALDGIELPAYLFKIVHKKIILGGILDKAMADHTRKLRAERDRLMEAVRESVAIEGKVSLYDAMNGIPEPQALKISQLYYKNCALLAEMEDKS